MEEINKNNNELPYKLLCKSWNFILKLYGVLLLVLIFLYLFHIDSNLLWSLSIIIIGNFFLLSVAQINNWIIEKESFKKGPEKWLFQSFEDCLIRNTAGLSEMLLYTTFFALKLETVIAGYLIMKSIGSWKPGDKDDEEEENKIDKNREYSAQKRRGLHLAVLRISVILSLILSFAAAYFLLKYLQNFSIIFLDLKIK